MQEHLETITHAKFRKANRVYHGKWQWLTLLLSFCSLIVSSTRVCNLFPSWSVKDFTDSCGTKKTTAKYMGCSQLTALKFWGRLLGQCQNCGLKESLFRQQQYLNGSLKLRWRRQQDRQNEHLTTLNTWNTPFGTFFHVDCATYNVKLTFTCYEGRKFSFSFLILDTALGPDG